MPHTHKKNQGRSAGKGAKKQFLTLGDVEITPGGPGVGGGGRRKDEDRRSVASKSSAARSMLSVSADDVTPGGPGSVASRSYAPSVRTDMISEMGDNEEDEEEEDVDIDEMFEN